MTPSRLLASTSPGLHSAYRDHVPPRVLEDQDVTRCSRHWKIWIAHTRASTFVARVDAAVAGFCSLQALPADPARGAIGELQALFVLPSFWRRGLGQLLCDRLLLDARLRGMAEVVLWVLESNQRARHFYQAQGFRADGTKRIFYERAGANVHDLRYGRRLAPTVE